MGTAARQVQSPQAKKITVTLKGTAVSVNPDPVYLKISAEQEALWCCDDGRLEILFDPNDTPFEGHQWISAKGGGCFSGVPRPGKVREALYKYTVKVTDRTGTHEIDPGVKVDP